MEIVAAQPQFRVDRQEVGDRETGDARGEAIKGGDDEVWVGEDHGVGQAWIEQLFLPNGASGTLARFCLSHNH